MTTTNNLYKLYIKSVFDLANTLIIKSTVTADGFNNYIIDYYGSTGVDLLDPTTWKYYLNLSGEYHSLDTMMTVVSLDTLENINFTKENLKIHAATYEGYKYGTRLYKELLSKYPTQELLIKGILYPVDIDTAITAADGTILGYPDGLVEINEYSLIDKLQDFINGYKDRWVNNQFSISDPLYPATALGILYLNLVAAIISFRQEACNTNEAHSFHIYQYLASHGFLGYHIDNLTLKQKLFFYRNINYIKRNAGKKETFDLLVEHLLTERGLPLSEFVMKHDLSDMPDSIYPTLVFHKKPLNNELSASTITKFSLSQILDKEDDLAISNSEYKNYVIDNIKEAMENSLSNTEATKLLESSVVDYSNSTPYTLEEILFNEWIYLSYLGIYKTYITVTNPKTDEKITLSAKDAFILYWYVYCKSIGIKLIEIPRMIATRVQRVVDNNNTTNVVGVDEIMSVVDPNIVPRSIAVEALSLQPNIVGIVSTKSFNELCVKIHSAAQMQRMLVSYQEHLIRRGMVFNMIERIYCDKACPLIDDGTTYAQWFKSKSIDIDDLSIDELGIFYTSIAKIATAASLNTDNSIRNLQKAMVSLFVQLSSYSIQVAADINDSSIKRTDWPAVRIGDVDIDVRTTFRVPDIGADIIDVDCYQKESGLITLDENNIFATVSQDVRDSGNLKLGIGISMDNKGYCVKAVVNLVGPRVAPTINLIKNSADVIPVIGITGFLNLTTTQKNSVRDIYTIIQSPPADTSEEQEANDNANAYQAPRYTTPRYDDEV